MLIIAKNTKENHYKRKKIGITKDLKFTNEKTGATLVAPVLTKRRFRR